MAAQSPDPHAIFNQALELPTDADRSKYLDEACASDPELKNRIEGLLRAHFEAGSFLWGKTDAPAKTDVRSITEQPGDTIGPYKLLQQIGEGGMGVVYMAEQTEPVERRVALKIIKPGMDTRQVIARFEAERQALAMMDHPNIAKVLDAGTTETGRPYFVMELVKGMPVTQYCDEQHLTPRERLELFLPICQAVQHAHQKGVIHRDLKPSNILIARYDDRAVPKIIDFGVAKAVSQRLTQKTMFTQYGQIVGTIEYMSPEQARFNQLDVDTRSDIYSLGVLLYELLTGETPFDKQRLRSAAFDELLRIIREEEPPRPSVKLSTSQSLPSVAANRKIEPHKLGTLVRGELDWIVMKALEKDRGRRYETASAFAADVLHYLNDEAVVACPPSAGYRLSKLARRNKAALAAGSLMVALILVAASGLAWRAGRQREHIRAVEARILDAAQEAAEAIAAGRWNDAEMAVIRAEETIAREDVSTAVRGEIKQSRNDLNMVERLNEARESLLDAGRDDHDPQHFRLVDATYAQAFADYGLPIDEATEEDLAARLRDSPIRSRLLAALDHWGQIRRYELRGASELWRKNVTLALLADDTVAHNRIRRAWLNSDVDGLRDIARRTPPSELSPEMCALLATYRIDHEASTRRVMAERDDNMGDFLRRALLVYPHDLILNHTMMTYQTNLSAEEALRYAQAIAALRPQDPRRIKDLAHFLSRLERAEETREVYDRVIELAPDEATRHKEQAELARWRGDYEESQRHLRQGLALDADDYWEWREVAFQSIRDSQWDESVAAARKAVEILPQNYDGHMLLAIGLLKRGDIEESLREMDTALKFTAGRPQAGAREWFAIELLEEGMHEKAILHYEELIRFYAENPARADVHALLVSGYHLALGTAHFALDQLDPAVDHLRLALRSNPTSEASRLLIRILSGQVVAISEREAYVAMERRLSEVLGAVPTLPKLWELQAEVRYRLDDWHGCLAALRHAEYLRVSGDSEPDAFHALYRGLVLQRLDRADEAVEWLRRGERRMESQATGPRLMQLFEEAQQQIEGNPPKP